MRHEAYCLDGEEEDFMRDYLILLQSFIRSAPQFRKRALAYNPPLRNSSLSQLRKKTKKLVGEPEQFNGVIKA